MNSVVGGYCTLPVLPFFQKRSPSSLPCFSLAFQTNITKRRMQQLFWPFSCFPPWSLPFKQTIQNNICSSNSTDLFLLGFLVGGGLRVHVRLLLGFLCLSNKHYKTTYAAVLLTFFFLALSASVLVFFAFSNKHCKTTYALLLYWPFSCLPLAPRSPWFATQKYYKVWVI